MQRLGPTHPKSASTNPLDQRPITVLPVLYRGWAAHRAQDLRGWQEEWADPALFGGIAQREALQAALEMNLDLEEASLQSAPWMAALLDYQKYFDSISWSILWPLARHLGLPPCMANACDRFYHALQSRFKVNGHYGPPFPEIIVSLKVAPSP